MKILILETDYPGFIEQTYAEHSGLEALGYDQQMRVRVESLFGAADFYSKNLRRLGCEAEDVFANNRHLQLAWAREHGVNSCSEWRKSFRWRGGFIPWLNLWREEQWFWDVLRAQVRDYKPDILFNHSMNGIPTGFLRELKQNTRLLVGQHAASALPENEDWGVYDLVVSSFPPTLDYFRARGLPAEYFRLGFEPGLLHGLKTLPEPVEVSFVGSLLPVHHSRIKWLEAVCAATSMRLWSPGIGFVPPSSPLHARYAGPAWGRKMYEVLRSSRITLNHHGDIAPFANNMRLYEATGVGSLLVTDWKANLGDMFEPGREVVCYRSTAECVELIQHFLSHPAERNTVAEAGNRRTLREHNYFNRMRELLEIIRRHLK